jgi:hypothetical protein
VKAQEHLAATYRQAVRALEVGDRPTAVKILAQIIYEEPYFKESARLFLYAVTGVDVEELRNKLKALEKNDEVIIEELQERIRELEKNGKRSLNPS